MKLNKNTVGVEAVNKALEILNCFTEKNEALTVTKIAKITAPPACQRLPIGQSFVFVDFESVKL